MKINAKSLILELLMASDGEPLQARDAIAASTLFGISENSVRVALARLSAEALVEGAGRGSYRLGPMALQLSSELAAWRGMEQRMRPWSGAYLMVACAALGRVDRSALQRRERALHMLGFAELEKGLYLRPDNIEADIDGVRQRLHKLGLEPEALLFRADQFGAEQERRIHALWDGAVLSAAYARLETQLEEWRQRAAELEPETAAREAFLLGRQAIRQAAFDPLLPEPLVDAAARARFFACVQRFVEHGHQIWRGLFDGSRPSPNPAHRPAADRLH